MAKIKSFTISLPVGDLNAGIAWYRRLIGAAEEVEPAPGMWECQIMPSVRKSAFVLRTSGLAYEIQHA